MVNALTPLGRALYAHRRRIGKLMGDQAVATGRPVLQISLMERGCVPLPENYVAEFSTWAALEPDATAALYRLPSTHFDKQECCIQSKDRTEARSRPKTRGPYIRAVSNESIRLEAAQVRRKMGLGNAETFSVLRLAEHQMPDLLLGYELHIEPADRMGGAEAYVAEFPPRMVMSDETYLSAFNNRGRQRFTIAHEIGHLILQRDYLKAPGARAARTSNDLSKLSRYEQQADSFASELLLPEAVVRAAGSDPDTLSQRCDVSKAAAERRLRSLGLWPRRSERVIAGFAELLAELRGERKLLESPLPKLLVREEAWGRLIYDSSKDEFRAEVMGAHVPTPKAPIGMGWIIIGGCNEECIHCYGNAEDLPRGRLSLRDSLQLVQAIKEAGIMRVVISGGEPLLYPGILDVIDALAKSAVSVVLGTNGTFLSRDNVGRLRSCTRVEISLDARDRALNNKIRVSKTPEGDAWKESVAAIRECLIAGVKVRVLTTINAFNQHSLFELAGFLRDLGVRDWALSWTIPAGRAARMYEELVPDEAVIRQELDRISGMSPAMPFRYSHRPPEAFDRYYFLVLPDGQIATEDIEAGTKQTFGSALDTPLLTTWTPQNFDLNAHFSKWVADRITSLP